MHSFSIPGYAYAYPFPLLDVTRDILGGLNNAITITSVNNAIILLASTMLLLVIVLLASTMLLLIILQPIVLVWRGNGALKT